MKENNKIETIGLAAAMGSFIAFDSSSRIQMYSSHISQTISPEDSNIPRAMTGLESQLGDFAFNIKMPVNGIVIAIHKKYKVGIGLGAIKENPITTIIYQNQENGIYDFIDIFEYHTKHRVFGIKFKINPIVNRLRIGSPIAAGTILAYNPNVKDGNIYANGLETNVAYMSIPCTIEDGFGVSESYIKRAKPLELLKFTTSWGRLVYPLNVYGDINNYKPFPDIGDTIRDDGLLFAMREYNDDFDALDMTPKGLMEIDMVHDTRTYGTAGSIVYDVNVETGIGESRAKPLTPPGMVEQANKYINSGTSYYNDLLETYNKLEKKERNLMVSPGLQNLITRALADKPNDHTYNRSTKATGKIRRTYRNIPLDEYRVEIKTAKRITIGLGAKLSDNHGGEHTGIDL